MPSPETKLNADVGRSQVVGMVMTGVGDGFGVRVCDGFGDGFVGSGENPEHGHEQGTSDPPQIFRSGLLVRQT